MKIKFTIPAIILGSDKTGLGIIRSLGSKGIPVYNIYYGERDLGQVSRYTKKSFRSPHPSDERKFIDFMLSLGPKWSGSVLFPSDNNSLSVVSKYKETLESKFVVPVDTWNVTSRYLNAQEIFDISEKEGIPAPRTYIPENYDKASCFLEEIGFPALLKPAPGYSLKNVFKQESILIENLSHLKNILTITQKFELKVILQEYIPGNTSILYDSFSVNGEPLLQFTAEKFRTSQPLNNNASVLYSRYIPEVFNLGIKLLSVFKVNGFISMVFKRDPRSGAYKLLKLTGRHNISSPLSAKCGINFPYHSYIYSSKGIIPGELSLFKENIYWIDAGEDLTIFMKNFGRKNLTIKEFITPYLRRKVMSIPSFGDPMPMMKRMKDITSSVPRVIFDSLKEKIAGII